jgi:hypothetical protein
MHKHLSKHIPTSIHTFLSFNSACTPIWHDVSSRSFKMNQLPIPVRSRILTKSGSVFNYDMLCNKRLSLCHLSASRMMLNAAKDFLPPRVLAFAGVSAAAISEMSLDLFSPSDATCTLFSCAWKYCSPLFMSTPFTMMGKDNIAKFDSRL